MSALSGAQEVRSCLIKQDLEADPIYRLQSQITLLQLSLKLSPPTWPRTFQSNSSLALLSMAINGVNSVLHLQQVTPTTSLASSQQTVFGCLSNMITWLFLWLTSSRNLLTPVFYV